MTNHYKGWTQHEIMYVRNNIELTDAELAEELGRSELSVRTMRRKNRILKNRPIGFDEVQIIINNPSLRAKDFAAMTGRHEMTFYNLKRKINGNGQLYCADSRDARGAKDSICKE